MMKNTLWILLPAFNEEKALPRLLPSIASSAESTGMRYRIVVVNDGSFDHTAKVLEEFSTTLPLDVISHPVNRGLGETERDGFEYLSQHTDDDDIIIRLDCDDTHESEYFNGMIAKIREGYDVVIATRFLPGGGQRGVNGYRAFISMCANVFMRMMFSIKGVRDYSCGFRAYRAQAIKHATRIFGNGFIQLKGLGFTSTLETIVKLNLMGCRFSEVPFVLRYDKKVGDSKMITSVTTLGYFTMALLHHWPFGGWRSHYRGMAELFRVSPAQALDKYGYRSKKRGMMCRIGG